MTQCAQTFLTIGAAVGSVFLAIFIIALLQDAFYAAKKIFNDYEWLNILLPASAFALAIFMVRVELPKHVDIVSCTTGEKINNVAFNFTCGNKS